MSVQHIIDRVQERLFWSGYLTDAESHIGKCYDCLRSKHPTHPIKELMIPIPSTAPLKEVGMGVLSPVLTSKHGNK